MKITAHSRFLLELKAPIEKYNNSVRSQSDIENSHIEKVSILYSDEEYECSRQLQKKFDELFDFDDAGDE